jgi:hypothetical protein
MAILAAGAALALTAGCSPKYNWRNFASPDDHYRVLFPARPSSVTRTIDLDGIRVAMTMTAVDIDGATFAVGAAVAPDAERAQAALAAMQTALVRNIDATVTSEKVAAASSDGATRAARDIDAQGKQNGVPMRLVAHFEARGKRLYQVIVLGKPASMPAEQVDQFLSSFKLADAGKP